MKVATICVFFLMLILIIFPTFGQQSVPRYNSDAEVVKYALDNVQQEDNFYFLPFPNNPPMATAGFNREGWNHPEKRAKDAQLVLKILASLEKAKRVEVISFQLIRDQETHFSSYDLSVFHGIFLKAKPNR